MDNNELGTNLAEVGTDCISRQAAIDALCNDYCGGHQDCKYYPNCENLRSVQKLPSAQPAEPKRGWWIEIINSRGVVVALRCSRCEKSPRHGVRSDYCPNCGAKMEVNNDR